MEREYLHIRVKINITEILKMGKKKELVNLYGQMVIHILENGRMIYVMEMGK